MRYDPVRHLLDQHASGVDFPDVLNADAGLIGFHVTNEDLVHYAFVIERVDLRRELPASNERRVEVDLTSGSTTRSATSQATSAWKAPSPFARAFGPRGRFAAGCFWCRMVRSFRSGARRT